MGHIRRQRSRRFDGRRGRQAALFGLGVAFGLALGPALGLVRAQAPAVPEERPVARASRPNETGPLPAAASPTPPPDPVPRALAAWIERAGEGVRRGADTAGFDAIRARVAEAGFELVAYGVIDGLEPDALERLIVSATDYEPEDLARVEDVPAFARNLTRIAIDGTLREAEAPDARILPIDFSREITWDHRAALPQSQFAADVSRIYASFESQGLGVGQALAKWTRVADGEILLFERHRLRPAARSSYVYLDVPDRGWRPGEYRVDFYRADESLAWLASGTHRITR